MHKGSTALTARACRHARGLERDSPATGQPEALLKRPRGECPLSATDIRLLILEICVGSSTQLKIRAHNASSMQYISDAMHHRCNGLEINSNTTKRAGSSNAARRVQSQDSVPRHCDCPPPGRIDMIADARYRHSSEPRNHPPIHRRFRMPPRQDFDASVPTISPDPADLFFKLFSRYILRRDQQVYKAIQLVYL